MIVTVNPRARVGRKPWLLPTLTRGLPTAQEIVVPSSREALTQRARRAVLELEPTLVVAGGDGTLNAAIQALAGTPVTLGIVPAGTANDLATGLGYPARIDASCRTLSAAVSRAIDLIEVNGQAFATGGGVGAIAGVVAYAEAIKRHGGATARLLGGLLYLLASALYILCARRLGGEAELVVDGASRGVVPYVAVFVMNQGTIGRHVAACPGADPTDGRFDVCLLHRTSRLATLRTLLALSMGGRHVGRPGVEVFQATTLELRSATPQAVIGDGEVLAQDAALRFTVRPQALRVLAPALR